MYIYVRVCVYVFGKAREMEYYLRIIELWFYILVEKVSENFSIPLFSR